MKRSTKFRMLCLIGLTTALLSALGQETTQTIESTQLASTSAETLNDETLKSAQALPNLLPYKPSTWDNKLVVSSGTGTNTSTAPLFNTYTLYVDWAVVNSSSVSVTQTFYSKLYLDGELKGTWYTSGLGANAWAYVQDVNLGSLVPGSHSIRIETDVYGVVTESNESDNTYTRSITVYPYVNLVAYQPAGWDSKIVLSTSTATHTSTSQIFDTENIYLDWAIANLGSSATTTSFYIDLYIDGVWKTAWTRSGIGANSFSTQSDYLIGKLPAGSHTFEIKIDIDGYIPEYNESDNSFARTITVVSKNLQPYQLWNWDSKLVISAIPGTHTTTAIYNNQDIYVDWAVINNGTAAVTETFHSKLYVDGVLKNSWYTNGLASNYYVNVQDYNIGKLDIGNHTIRINVDSDAEVTESSEADNSYSRTIYVGPSINLRAYKPSTWDDKLVLSVEKGTSTSATAFYDFQNIYVDGAVINNAYNDLSTAFIFKLYVDDVLKGTYTKTGLAHNTYTWFADHDLGKLVAGVHTIRLVIDPEDDVAESDETDNVYSRTITVLNKNLLFYQPVSWDDKLVVSTGPGTNETDTQIFEHDPLYIDYAVHNNGNAAISETFYVRLYIDGIPLATWTKTGIGANTYYTIQDFPAGTLPAGVHTLKVVADILNNVTETSESDNEYSRIINILPSPAVNYPSASGIIWNPGTIYEITWQNFIDPYVKIELMKGGTVVRTITSSTVNDGTMQWKVAAMPAGDDYQIRVSSTATPGMTDLSDNYFTIEPAASPVVTYPSEAGITWEPGTIYEITWENYTDPYVRIELLKDGTLVRTIASSRANSGSMLWKVAALAPGNDYKVRITSTSTPSMTDLSDNNLTIVPVASPEIIYPSAPSIVWNPGNIYEITWINFTDPYVKIELLKGSTLVRTVTTGTANDGSMLWRAPAIETGNDYRIRITSTTTPTMSDISDNYFALQPAASPSISYPSESGIVWDPGTIYEITWQDFTDPYVKIELLKGGTLVRTITTSTTNDGTMLWRVASLPAGNDYKVRITSTVTPTMTDLSDNNFTISGPPMVSYPSAAGIVWDPGIIYEITWQNFTDPYVRIELLQGGSLVRTITTATVNDGSMLWRVATLPAANDYKIRITSTATPAMTDMSDNNFSISGTKSVMVSNNDPGSNSLSVYPNPFRDRATINYTLAEAGRALLEIYDLTGRKVTTLQDATMEAGTHIMEWNANDANGQAVVPGIYLVRIQSGGFVQTEKIVFNK